MYEDKRFIGKKVRWSSVFLKLLLLILILTLVWFIIYHKKTTVKKSPKGNDMTENLKYFKDNAKKYFTDDKLPIYNNSKVKVTLDEIIKEKGIKPIIDKNGEACSIYSSYAQVTKVNDENYTLKVYLKCKNEADSILTTIKKSNKNNKNNNKVNNNNDDKKNNASKDDNKSSNGSKNQNSNSNTSSNKSNSSKSSSSSSKSSSKSSSSSSKSSSGSSSSSSSSSSSTVTIVDTTKPTQVLDYILYKHARYGEWTTDELKDNYQVSSMRIKYYKYCTGNDYENCPVFAKVPEYMDQINSLLKQGYEEILVRTETITIYRTADCIWSKEKSVDGYEYTGTYKEVYKTI